MLYKRRHTQGRYVGKYYLGGKFFGTKERAKEGGSEVGREKEQGEQASKEEKEGGRARKE